jgi:hypothetical protein
MIATGGCDGKLRLWDAKSHLCFTTLSEHDSKSNDSFIQFIHSLFIGFCLKLRGLLLLAELILLLLVVWMVLARRMILSVIGKVI